jgi:chitinase
MTHRLLLAILCASATAFAQLPDRVLVGYWQNWSPLRLRDIPRAYNVVELAFATTRADSDHELEFNLPGGYSRSQFLSDLDSLHARGAKVVLSVGGAADPVRLTSDSERDRFVATLDSLLQSMSDKVDGIDLDFESSSMDFGAWTMASPAPGQTRIVAAVRTVMQKYRARTGRKLLLTMAPELIYLQGALSRWQTDNAHGGAWLPVLQALRDSVDLLMPQFYNAGGAGGGVIAIDGRVYFDTGDPDFVTSQTETLLRGFSLLDGRGSFPGWPAAKFAVGVPANSCTAAGTGYLKPDSLALALRTLRGEVPSPANASYTLRGTYPDLRGVMTWSINEDASSCDGAWNFSTRLASWNTTSVTPRHAAAPRSTPPWTGDALGRSRPSDFRRIFVPVP